MKRSRSPRPKPPPTVKVAIDRAREARLEIKAEAKRLPKEVMSGVTPTALYTLAAAHRKYADRLQTLAKEVAFQLNTQPERKDHENL